MSDIVEFILRAQDEMSKTLHGASRESEKAARSFDKLGKAESQLDKIMKSTGDSAKNLEDKLKKLREFRDIIPDGAERQLKRVNTEIDRMEGKLTRVRTMGRRGGLRSRIGHIAEGTIGSLPGMGGMEFLPPQLLAGMAALVGAGALLRTGAKREFERIQYRNELGGQGSDLLDRVRNMNPLLGDGAKDSALQMARSGMNNRLIENTLTRLGDVANGDETRLGNLAAIMAEINKEGKLTQETLNALEENGFNPLFEISENTGRSFDQLFDDLDQGKITTLQVTQALRTATEEGGRFFENMERLSETAIGNWERMTKSLSESFGSLGEDFGTKVMGAYEGVRTAGGLLDESDPQERDLLTLLKNIFTGGNEKYSWEQNPQEKGVPAAWNALGMLGSNENSPLAPGPWASDEVNKQREMEEAKARREEANKVMQDRINAVSGGGVRNITINIDKMIERISNTFTNGGTEDYARSLEEVTQEAVVRALASAAGR